MNVQLVTWAIPQPNLLHKADVGGKMEEGILVKPICVPRKKARYKSNNQILNTILY